MRVTIIGANGNIGRLTAKKLQADGQTPIAMVRKKEQMADFKEQGIQSVYGDLTGGIDDLTDVVRGSDAVVFTAGSGGSTGPEQTMLVDLDGAVKAIEATKKAGIDRFLIVSAIGADRWLTDHPQWLDQLGAYYPAKYYADAWLKNSGLNYTIIRPGGLTNDPETGKVTIGKAQEPVSISRSDVAEIIVTALKYPPKKPQEFDAVGGQTPIVEALKQLDN